MTIHWKMIGILRAYPGNSPEVSDLPLNYTREFSRFSLSFFELSPKSQELLFGNTPDSLRAFTVNVKFLSIIRLFLKRSPWTLREVFPHFWAFMKLSLAIIQLFYLGSWSRSSNFLRNTKPWSSRPIKSTRPKQCPLCHVLLIPILLRE